MRLCKRLKCFGRLLENTEMRSVLRLFYNFFLYISVPEGRHVFRKLGRDGRLEGGRSGPDQRVHRGHKAGLSYLGKTKLKKKKN